MEEGPQRSLREALLSHSNRIGEELKRKGKLSIFHLCCMQKENIITDFPLDRGSEKNCQFACIAETVFNTLSAFSSNSALPSNKKKNPQSTHKIKVSRMSGQNDKFSFKLTLLEVRSQMFFPIMNVIKTIGFPSCTPL